MPTGDVGIDLDTESGTFGNIDTTALENRASGTRYSGSSVCIVITSQDITAVLHPSIERDPARGQNPSSSVIGRPRPVGQKGRESTY